MQSAKRIVLAEMSPDNNPFLLTPPRVIKCVTELLGYILNKVYLNNENDNKIEDKRHVVCGNLKTKEQGRDFIGKCKFENQHPLFQSKNS